ncbi:AraC family ligand binding domain-containing protein [Undibacterium sp. Di27W]|uniref:AraC family transcriptional regulator n=1 Tax=Undibacterium sp. Di27W TaxID=3413036 RepID=UPI003BF31C25
MKDQLHYKRVAQVPGLVLSGGRLAEFHFDRHYHLDYHIGLVSEGVQRQKFRGNSVLLGPGGIVLMPPGEIHDGVGEGGDAYTLKTFRLPVELFHQVSKELSGSEREPALVGTMLEDPLRAAHFLRLYEAMHATETVSPLALQSEWLSLLEFVFTQSKTIKPQSIKGGLSPQHIQRIKEYCVAHLSQKISLDELAAICGLGQFHFLRQFKYSIGMTPHAWLVRLRLEYACALLGKNPASIADVAHLVGFYDQSHFNRAFKQAFGVAPSSY